MIPGETTDGSAPLKSIPKGYHHFDKTRVLQVGAHP